jgi:hypothetical protein
MIGFINLAITNSYIPNYQAINTEIRRKDKMHVHIRKQIFKLI